MVCASAAEFNPMVGMRTKEEIQVIESMRQPEFTAPYPLLEANRNAVKAISDSRAWIEQQSISSVYDDPKEQQKFMNSNVFVLPTKIFVDADRDELSWLCSYFALLFACDDWLEKFGLSFSAEDSASLLLELNLVIMWTFPDDRLLRSNLGEFLSLFPEEKQQATLQSVEDKLGKARLHVGSVYDTSGLEPLCTCFRDLWRRQLDSASPLESKLRWGQTFQQYLVGNISEVKNRHNLNIPSITDCITIRRSTSAMDTCMVIVDYVDKLNVSLPDDLYDSLEMKAFLDAINDVVSWHNDIWSFKKEMRSGHVHNLIYVISLEKRCSFSDAGKIAMEMLYERLRDLDRSIVNVERITPPQYKGVIERYIKAAHCWVSAGHEFASTSERYL